MLAVALEAVEAAVRVTFCDAAGVTLTVLGDALTPGGSPVIATETDPLKELMAFAETVMSAPEPPACSVTEVGETASEKSGEEDEEGAPVLELPDLELPHDVRKTTQHSRDAREQNFKGDVTPGDLITK